ncbi:MAG: general secretion pathway protein GspK [Oceanicaulis sp.]
MARERGSALVFVLWIALLVSILAAGAAVAVRARIIETRIEETVMREEAALRSALDLAAFQIALEGRASLENLPRTFVFGEDAVRVGAAPFHRRIDVNLADDTAFMRLFQGLGAGEGLARRLTDQILDWRDADSLPRPFGAEAQDYAARPGGTIGDRPFLDVRELAQVLDMTPARLACAAPYLTVQGGSGPAQGAPLQGLEPPAAADGIRAALTATLIGPAGEGRSLTGIVQFGVSDTRPFGWVAFSGDDGAAPACPDGAFSG